MFVINGDSWSVIAVPANYYKLFRSDNSLTVGVCDNEDKTIYINSNLQGSFLKKVLCHEITHAAMFSYNVELTIDQEELLANLIATYGNEIITITNEVFSKMKGIPA